MYIVQIFFFSLSPEFSYIPAGTRKKAPTSVASDSSYNYILESRDRNPELKISNIEFEYTWINSLVLIFKGY